MSFLQKSLSAIALNFLLAPAYAMFPVVDIGAIAQLANQLQQLKQEAQYLKLTLKQLNHGQFRWGNTDVLIKRLTQLTDQSTAVVSDAGMLDKQFRVAYPGYAAQKNFSETYKNTVSGTLKKLNGVSQALSAHAYNFKDENARLVFLQQQAQQAQGQTQAIQAASQIASENVTQLQLLRQSVLAQSSAQVNFYATQLQKEASTQAELEKVLQAGSTQLSAPSHPLTLPRY